MEDYLQKLVDEVKKDFPKLVLEQVFTGIIKEIEEDTVFVQLYDKTHEGEDFWAEMDLYSFPKDPLYPEITPGIIFYWYLGYEEKVTQPFSLIRYSQAVWTQEMIDKAKVEAEKLSGVFDNLPKPKIAD